MESDKGSGSFPCDEQVFLNDCVCWAVNALIELLIDMYQRLVTMSCAGFPVIRENRSEPWMADGWWLGIDMIYLGHITQCEKMVTEL